MSRNSHRSFQREQFRAVLVFILLVAVTLPSMFLPKPAAAGPHKIARPGVTESTEGLAGTTTNGSELLAGANVTGYVTFAAQPQSSPLPGRLIYQSRPGGYGMNVINPNGTNRINLTDYGAGVLDRPSVSEQTGMVAFEAADLRITPPLDFQDHRIFVMNSDGTGIKQITFAPNPGPDARSTMDTHPKISPDGTRVAFISLRTAGQSISCPNSTRTGVTSREVWVVNVDGSNLHQVTTTQVSVDTGGGCGTSDNLEVAWSANSNQLVVMGVRPYTFTVMPRSPGIFDSLTILSAGGGGETTVALDIPAPSPGQPDEPVTRANIAPRDGNGVGFLDWSSSGTVLFSSTINNQNGSVGQIVQGGQPTYALSQDLMGQGGLIWDVRYSPDGTHFLFAARSPAFVGDSNTHLFIDGGGGMVQNTGSVADFAVEWSAGPPITTPNQLGIAPNPLFLYGQTPARVTPTLLDADSNVIVRTAQWRVDGAGFRCDNTADQIPCVGIQLQASNNVDFTGLVKGGTSELQGNLCGINGTLMGCTPYFNTQASAFLSITATNPTAFTSGIGGPGVFTIKREGTPPTTPPISVAFIVSGTAVRDVDYTFDFTGNTIILPYGQNSVNINVRPLHALTADQTVIITLQSDSLNNYRISQLYKSSATVTIKDDSFSAALSLLRITPNTGGDQGAVTATVYGTNIQQGATVKLARGGQSDIVGENAIVGVGGSSISALFNLIGRMQGAWDVVVTNPDGATANIARGFSIEATKEADIWVDISGRDSIRASHTATTYTILVGNRGNVDAFAVPLFITGIPLNAEVQLLFNPLQVPDYTDGTLSAIVRNDVAQSIPLLLPVVRAGATNYYRITLRSNQFTEGSFDLNAFSLEPLLKPVPQTVSNRTAIKSLNTPGIRLNHTRLRSTALIPSGSFTAFVSSPEGIACMGSLLQAVLNCGSAIYPILSGLKEGACIAGFINFMGGIATTAVSAASGGLQNDQSGAIAMGQIPMGLIAKAGSCIPEEGAVGLAKLLPGIGNIMGGISCGLSLYDALYNNCYKGYKQFRARTIGSTDPNEKAGARGTTEANYISDHQPLPYSIFFENQDTATAPAQTVVVTDQLDKTKLDLSTFSLGLIGFGSKAVVPGPGLQSYDTDVDLRPGTNLIVRIHAALDSATGIVTWQFQSIDPATNLPTTDPNAGFLPPDIDGIVGEGSVLFSVMPKGGIADGTQINNTATITFDLNSPLNTNTFSNTIDGSAPESYVHALPPQESATFFPIEWSGADTGSGIATYTIYVSTNGGPYSPWIYNTTATSGLFVGQPNTSYAFYSVARDGADNIEAPPAVADAITMTSSCGTITLTPSLSTGIIGSPYNQTISASGGAVSYSFAVTNGSLPSGLNLNASTGVLSGTPSALGPYNFSITATDASGCTGTQSYSMSIGCPSILVGPSSLPSGTVGSLYNAMVSAGGGATAYTFAVTDGVLPAGLSLNANTGEINGTPTTSGSVSFTVTATDANGCTGSSVYSVAIGCPTIALSPATLSNGTVGVAYNQSVSASGTSGTFTFSVTGGALPGGLTLNSLTGQISGTPTTVQTANFTITASDTIAGCSGSRSYTVTIKPAFPCPLGQGYWKNNANAWPVTSLTNGGKVYTKTELLKILDTAAGSGKNTDASLILAYQLIAAKLNLAYGTDPAPVVDTIGSADALLATYAGKLPYKVTSSSTAGQNMIAVAAKLENYNSRLLTPNCGP